MERIEALERGKSGALQGGGDVGDPPQSATDTRYRVVNSKAKIGDVKYSNSMDDIYFVELMGAVSDAAGRLVKIEELMAEWLAANKRTKEVMSEILQRKIYHWVLGTLTGEDKRKVHAAADTNDGVWAINILLEEMRENQRMRKEAAIAQYGRLFKGSTVEALTAWLEQRKHAYNVLLAAKMGESTEKRRMMLLEACAENAMLMREVQRMKRDLERSPLTSYEELERDLKISMGSSVRLGKFLTERRGIGGAGGVTTGVSGIKRGSSMTVDDLRGEGTEKRRHGAAGREMYTACGKCTRFHPGECRMCPSCLKQHGGSANLQRLNAISVRRWDMRRGGMRRWRS